MSADAILRLERTTLFELLIQKEKTLGGDHEISQRVKAVVGHVAPLMERIPDKMPEYTLHDPNHGAKVVELMGLIIPKDTLEALNPIELSILIYSGYLHDLGMTCSTSEREKIIESNVDFSKLLASDARRAKQILTFRESGHHRAATHVEDQVFTEYLRRHHVKRSADFIESELSHGATEIAWKGTAYWRLVQAVCDSHALPVHALRDSRRWPRDALVRNMRVNVQYLALVLRLGDILDLDPERTPKALLDFIDPTDPTSIIEWNKHRSVIGWEITPERIRFEAICTDAVYERALREFIGWIEVERSESVALASSYRDDLAKQYHLDLTDPVTTDRIQSDGSYIFSALRFEVDHERIINLLMGERLYRSPAVALRELLQNAFDAIRYREALEKRDGSEFTPKVVISLQDKILSVEDNGIGMDTDIIARYFMQVGRSYYTSPQFRSDNLNLDIVSEFGIGVLSAFMVAEHLTVESRRRPSDPLSPPEPVLIQIPTAHRYFVQRPSRKTSIGTKISLSLKEGHPFNGDSLAQLVATMVPFNEYSIVIEINGVTTVHAPHDAKVISLAPRSNQSKFLEIRLDDEKEENLKGLSGTIAIVSRQPHLPYEYSNNSVVAQCGFAVNDFDRDQLSQHPAAGLFPAWTQVLTNLDIRPPARLSLTPDRSNIVHDQQFKEIEKAVDQYVVRGMRRHLSEKMQELSSSDYAEFVDQLIDEGALKAESYVGFELSAEAKELFLDAIPFRCIDVDGSLNRIMGKELLCSDLILLTDPRAWPKDTSPSDIRTEVDEHFGKVHPILVEHDMGDYHRSSIYKHLFDEISGHLILSVPGVVLDLIDNSGERIADDSIEGITHVSYDVQATKNAHSPAIFHCRESNSISFEYPYINVRHPFFAPLFGDKTVDELEHQHGRLIVDLHEQIIDLLMECMAEDSSKATISLGRITNRRRSQLRDSISMQSPNRILVGILNRNATLFPAIRSVFVDYWERALDNGAIRSGLAIPDFTVADLPWFWSLPPKGKIKPKQKSRA